ncbi:septum formation initiator family protein [Candidatus Peregrinibacteria bacterium]|nr:septum formation initiator family protein [Candidatus Peregrinibacteria bacterium]
MSSRFSNTSSLTKVIIIVEFLLVAYLIYSLTKNVYNSYKIDQYIELFKDENAKIDHENKQKTNDYLYFTSEEYIDKIAKQNLGLINPGEEVIILSQDALDEIAKGDVDAENIAKYSGLPVRKQWWKFFFGK